MKFFLICFICLVLTSLTQSNSNHISKHKSKSTSKVELPLLSNFGQGIAEQLSLGKEVVDSCMQVPWKSPQPVNEEAFLIEVQKLGEFFIKLDEAVGDQVTTQCNIKEKIISLLNSKNPNPKPKRFKFVELNSHIKRKSIKSVKSSKSSKRQMPSAEKKPHQPSQEELQKMLIEAKKWSDNIKLKTVLKFDANPGVIDEFKNIIDSFNRIKLLPVIATMSDYLGCMIKYKTVGENVKNFIRRYNWGLVSFVRGWKYSIRNILYIMCRQAPYLSMKFYYKKGMDKTLQKERQWRNIGRMMGQLVIAMGEARA